MRLITWNINSIRLRLSLLAQVIAEHQPDIIAVQETKVVDELFPSDAIKSMGYTYHAFKGEKSYNGVAIISRLPIKSHHIQHFANRHDSRHIAIMLDNNVTIHNFYIPAGGDEPDVAINPKFSHKLEFLTDMRHYLSDYVRQNGKTIICGDFNIAPHENDVWSHKQLLKVVSHTPIEVEHLNAIKDDANFIDIARFIHGDDERLYSWWSYRNKDWQKHNRGRRLDHIWASHDLQAHIQAITHYSAARNWLKPSDHVPVIADFTL